MSATQATQPLGMEMAFVTPDVAKAHTIAMSAGAREIKSPQQKPWGQTVSYVRCPNGTLIELCSPMAG